MGHPTFLTLNGGEEKTLYYGTLFAPYESDILDRGITAVEPCEGGLLLRGQEGGTLTLPADAAFSPGALTRFLRGYPLFLRGKNRGEENKPDQRRHNKKVQRPCHDKVADHNEGIHLRASPVKPNPLTAP